MNTVVSPIPKKDDYSLRIITYFLIIVSFVLVMILCLTKRSDAEAFYSSFGSGATFVTSLWYMIPVFIVTYGCIFFVLYNTKKISIWMVLLVIIFLIISVIVNLFFYYFIPETVDNYTISRIKVTSGINIVPLVLISYLIYNNNYKPIISYLISVALIVFSSFSISINVNSS